MRRRTDASTRVLPDGTPLHNRLLAALPALDYNRITQHLRVQTTAIGDMLHEPGRRIRDVYFPNGGVYSIPLECAMVRWSRSRRSAGKACSVPVSSLEIDQVPGRHSNRWRTGH